MAREVPRNLPGTRGLRRDAGLVALSRDHHHVLVQALALKRAGDATTAGARRAVEAFLRHYREDMLGHFGDEEEVLLPALEASDPEGVRRVREEHAEVHAAVRGLEEALCAGGDPGRPAAALGRLLDDHVRYEERALFESAQRALDPGALARLGRAMDERRAARGAAVSCAVPRR